MRSLRALLLGAVAAGLSGYALVAALAVAAQAGGATFEIALGPLVVAAVERSGGTTVTTFGPGLVGIALVGGVANLGAALLIARRRRRSRGRVQ